MGWLEFRRWLRVMNKQIAGQRTQPDSWAGVENDPQWAEIHRERDRLLGR